MRIWNLFDSGSGMEKIRIRDELTVTEIRFPSSSAEAEKDVQFIF